MTDGQTGSQADRLAGRQAVENNRRKRRRFRVAMTGFDARESLKIVKMDVASGTTETFNYNFLKDVHLQRRI